MHEKPATTIPNAGTNQIAGSSGKEGQLTLFAQQNESFTASLLKVANQEVIEIAGNRIPRYCGEFWTARQRQANNIHEISYRACFKPQLPRFFIEKLTKPGDVVYDPFAGRGTTIVEAALLDRNVIANDVNPLSALLSRPRLFVPELSAVSERLYEIPFTPSLQAEIDLSMFYHPATEAELVSLRDYLIARSLNGSSDEVDDWIRMVATNRLTGHSKGFFSVYTLPPNQATSPERQRKINEQRKQTPEYRDVRALILKKSNALMSELDSQERERLRRRGATSIFITSDARSTQLPDNHINLTVTSPPFLSVVQYDNDNWMRCWFNGLDNAVIAKRITMAASISEWRTIMTEVFRELFRITRPMGYIAFEVGEVLRGSVRLDEIIVPVGLNVGFTCECIIINQQKFTKTANIWGIANNNRGTNSNRIVVFRKLL